RHTRSKRDWSSDVCSSDLGAGGHERGGRAGAGFVLHGDGEEAAGVHGVLREDGGVALNLRGVALLVTCGDAGVARGLLGSVGGGDLNSDVFDPLVEFRTDDVPDRKSTRLNSSH